MAFIMGKPFEPVAHESIVVISCIRFKTGIISISATTRSPFPANQQNDLIMDSGSVLKRHRKHVAEVNKEFDDEFTPVLLSPAVRRSLLVLLYENPVPAGDSTNSTLAAAVPTQQKAIHDQIKQTRSFVPAYCGYLTQRTQQFQFIAYPYTAFKVHSPTRINKRGIPLFAA